MESCRQIVDEKVTFCVVSVNHSEGDVIQTQSQNSAEKYFFKCPIKTHPSAEKYFFKCPIKTQLPHAKSRDKPCFLHEKTPQVGLEPTAYRLTAGCSAIELLRIIYLLHYSINAFGFI